MLLFFSFRVWADNIYRGIIRSRPICLPQNNCLIYIIHQRRTAVCATQTPVLKSELMTTRYVENKDDDVAKRAALLPKRGGAYLQSMDFQREPQSKHHLYIVDCFFFTSWPTRPISLRLTQTPTPADRVVPIHSWRPLGHSTVWADFVCVSGSVLYLVRTQSKK